MLSNCGKLRSKNFGIIFPLHCPFISFVINYNTQIIVREDCQKVIVKGIALNIVEMCTLLKENVYDNCVGTIRCGLRYDLLEIKGSVLLLQKFRLFCFSKPNQLFSISKNINCFRLLAKTSNEEKELGNFIVTNRSHRDACSHALSGRDPLRYDESFGSRRVQPRPKWEGPSALRRQQEVEVANRDSGNG